MEIIVPILLLMAIAQVLYENVAKPIILLYLRYRLFTLRDKLRWYAVENKNQTSYDVLSYIQNSMNISINYLDTMDLRTVTSIMRTIHKNKELEMLINKRIESFNRKAPIELKNLQTEGIQIFFYAVVANMIVGWVLAIPCFIIAKLVKFSIKSLINKFPSIPESEARSLIPSCSMF